MSDLSNIDTNEVSKELNELIEILKVSRYSEKNPLEVVFLIGAGLSANSGVPTTPEIESHLLEMMFLDEEFGVKFKKWPKRSTVRNELIKIIRRNNPKNIESQYENWKDSTFKENNPEYFNVIAEAANKQLLKEKTLNQPDIESLRGMKLSEYFESISTGAMPDMGYNMLAMFLEKWNPVNKILTTNFDGLIVKVIQQRGTLIPFQRTWDKNAYYDTPFNQETNIIDIYNLHGQRVTSRNLKSTLGTGIIPEIKESFELIGSASRHSLLIVLGYSGRDETIKDGLKALANPKVFTEGVWWQTRDVEKTKSMLDGVFKKFEFKKDIYGVLKKIEVENNKIKYIKYHSADLFLKHLCDSVFEGELETVLPNQNSFNGLFHLSKTFNKENSNDNNLWEVSNEKLYCKVNGRQVTSLIKKSEEEKKYDKIFWCDLCVFNDPKLLIPYLANLFLSSDPQIYPSPISRKSESGNTENISLINEELVSHNYLVVLTGYNYLDDKVKVQICNFLNELTKNIPNTKFGYSQILLINDEKKTNLDENEKGKINNKSLWCHLSRCRYPISYSDFLFLAHRIGVKTDGLPLSKYFNKISKYHAIVSRFEGNYLQIKPEIKDALIATIGYEGLKLDLYENLIDMYKQKFQSSRDPLALIEIIHYLFMLEDWSRLVRVIDKHHKYLTPCGYSEFLVECLDTIINKNPDIQLLKRIYKLKFLLHRIIFDEDASINDSLAYIELLLSNNMNKASENNLNNQLRRSDNGFTRLEGVKTHLFPFSESNTILLPISDAREIIKYILEIGVDYLNLREFYKADFLIRLSLEYSLIAYRIISHEQAHNNTEEGVKWKNLVCICYFRLSQIALFKRDILHSKTLINLALSFIGIKNKHTPYFKSEFMNSYFLLFSGRRDYLEAQGKFVEAKSVSSITQQIVNNLSSDNSDLIKFRTYLVRLFDAIIEFENPFGSLETANKMIDESLALFKVSKQSIWWWLIAEIYHVKIHLKRAKQFKVHSDVLSELAFAEDSLNRIRGGNYYKDPWKELEIKFLELDIGHAKQRSNIRYHMSIDLPHSGEYQKVELMNHLELDELEHKALGFKHYLLYADVLCLKGEVEFDKLIFNLNTSYSYDVVEKRFENARYYFEKSLQMYWAMGMRDKRYRQILNLVKLAEQQVSMLSNATKSKTCLQIQLQQHREELCFTYVGLLSYFSKFKKMCENSIITNYKNKFEEQFGMLGFTEEKKASFIIRAANTFGNYCEDTLKNLFEKDCSTNMNNRNMMTFLLKGLNGNSLDKDVQKEGERNLGIDVSYDLYVLDKTFGPRISNKRNDLGDLDSKIYHNRLSEILRPWYETLVVFSNRRFKKREWNSDAFKAKITVNNELLTKQLCCRWFMLLTRAYIKMAKTSDELKEVIPYLAKWIIISNQISDRVVLSYGYYTLSRFGLFLINRELYLSKIHDSNLKNQITIKVCDMLVHAFAVERRNLSEVLGIDADRLITPFELGMEPLDLSWNLMSPGVDMEFHVLVLHQKGRMEIEKENFYMAENYLKDGFRICKEYHLESRKANLAKELIRCWILRESIEAKEEKNRLNIIYNKFVEESNKPMNKYVKDCFDSCDSGNVLSEIDMEYVQLWKDIIKILKEGDVEALKVKYFKDSVCYKFGLMNDIRKIFRGNSEKVLKEFVEGEKKSFIEEDKEVWAPFPNEVFKGSFRKKVEGELPDIKNSNLKIKIKSNEYVKWNVSKPQWFVQRIRQTGVKV